jgi:hypothetical protein
MIVGLYPISCPVCGKGHLWFSGNLDTRCGECQKAASVVKVTKPCGHEPCELPGCQGCSNHCGKAIKLIRKETKDATKKEKQTKRKGDSK